MKLWTKIAVGASIVLVLAAVAIFALQVGMPDAPDAADLSLPHLPVADSAAPADSEHEMVPAAGLVSESVDKPVGVQQPLPAPSGKFARDEIISGEFVLSFDADSDRRAFEIYARAHGIRVLDHLAFGNMLRVRVPNAKTLKAMLKKAPVTVDWAPNVMVRVPENQPKPLEPDGSYVAFGSRVLSWMGVQDSSGWGKGVTVAVLDSGIDADALSSAAVDSLNLTDDAVSGGSHGTAVASIVLGGSDDFAGIAPDAKLLSIKVISDQGSGDAFTLAKGIVEAVDRGAKIINMSVASRSDSFAVREAVEYAAQHGVLMVSSVGNDAVEGVRYPAAYPEVMGVAAVDYNRKHAYFSNRGDEVDIAAPGIGVAASARNGETELFSGTSAAAPIVAGAAAAVWSDDPELSAADVRELLLKYSDDAGAPGDDPDYGAGTIDLGRIKERDQAQIYDMVAIAPHVVQNDAVLHLDVAAQNRGTEVFDAVEFLVVFGMDEQHLQFYNIAPGDTVYKSFEFALQNFDGVDFRFYVQPIGVSDVSPGNNGMHMHISPEIPSDN
jgi:subtilisin family serine protease